MRAAVCGAGGMMYAVVLWWIAARAARRREIPLGSLPVWLLVASVAAGAAAGAALPPAAALPAAAALIGAIVGGFVDGRTGYIFDALSFAVAVAGCAAAILTQRIADGVLGAGAVGGTLLLLYAVTRRRGIGLGDVKLGGAVGFGLGLQGGLVTVGSAFVLGAFAAAALLATGRVERRGTLRFGPFIAGGAAVGLTTVHFGWPW